MSGSETNFFLSLGGELCAIIIKLGAWFGSEFWAAVAGAVIGGIITYRMQRSATKAAKKQRDEDREEERKALGHSLLFKMLRIHSNFANLFIDFEDAVKNKPIAQPWARLQPQASLPDTVHFTSAEMGLLLSLKDLDLMNTIMDFDAAHNAMIGNLTLYRERRFALTAQMPAIRDGASWATGFTEKQLQLFEPRMDELNQLVLGMHKQIKNENDASTIALAKLNELLNEKLSLGVKFVKLNGDPLVNDVK